MYKMFKVVFLLLIFPVFFLYAQTQELFEAARKGDIQKVQELVDQDKSLVQAKDNRDCTALHYAVNGGFYNLAEFLIGRGIDIHAKDADGDTPLHWAAFAGHRNIAELLLSEGARLNEKNQAGLTALNYAVNRNQKAMVAFLVSQNAEVDSEGDRGRLLLHRAASGGYRELVGLFLDRGIGLESKNNAGGSLLHSAAEGGLDTLVQTLISRGFDVNQRDIYGRAPIHLAAGAGHLEVVKTLISNRADIQSKLNDGRTALHCTLDGGHQDVADLLAANGLEHSETVFVVLKGDYIGQQKPGLVPELFAPGIVSTGEWDERDVTFSPDLTIFYYTRYSRIRRERMTIQTMKISDGMWTKPATASFSGQYADAETFITPNGLKLYFISRRPQNPGENPSSWEIWFAERTETGWGEPTMMDVLFKGGYYPTVTADGTIYYTAADNDIHRSRLVDGKYLTTENLGYRVNTPEAEYNSCIGSDERFIIYSSVGFDDSFGQGDLYISYRNEDDSWGQAVNLGNPINSTGEDYCPSISPDGNYFFFSSNRNGNEDIFWVDSDILENYR